MCKIVIIEDDIDICNMIKKFLENNKYSVQYALNGIEGINLCKSFVPDLIILDIMLPGLNGDDVLQKLRKFTNAPVIVVSAKTMVQTKIELLKIGADDYMTKPFDLYELLARIEANLKRTVDNPYQNNNTLIYKNIKINNSLVYINGVLVPFTSTELSILEWPTVVCRQRKLNHIRPFASSAYQGIPRPWRMAEATPLLKSGGSAIYAKAPEGFFHSSGRFFITFSDIPH